MVNNFIKSELRGRLLFKSFLDLIGATGLPTVASYDRVDYFFSFQNKKAVAEIKVRTRYYLDFMVEVDKFNALIQRKLDTGLNLAYYVVFYSNQMYLFSASVIKKYGKPTSLYCPKTTAINKGYKYKDVLLVPTDKAIRFDYINNKWLKV